MAGRLNAMRMLRSASLLVALSVAHAAAGQTLSDPTRPPNGFYAGSTAVAPAADGGGLVLQSVLIHPDTRSAIISGEHVALGEKIHDQRLIRVNETEVVLLSGRERRTLKLFPDAEKKLVSRDRTRLRAETPIEQAAASEGSKRSR